MPYILIDLQEQNKCLDCGKLLNFEYESPHSSRMIATCCNKEYWAIPTSLYKLERICDEESKECIEPDMRNAFLNQFITVNMWAVIGKKGYYNFETKQFTFKASMECMLPSKDVAKTMTSYLDEPIEVSMVQISVTEYIKKYIRDSFKSLTIPLNSKFYSEFKSKKVNP